MPTQVRPSHQIQMTQPLLDQKMAVTSQSHNQLLSTQLMQQLSPTTEVQFIVKCSQTQPRDRVAIVGNLPQLGEWNPELCLFLETDQSKFPFWSVSLNLPKDGQIEYKFIVVQQQTII